MKILIQAREREAATLLGRLLEPYRYEIFASGTVDAAVIVARKEGPLDVVLCLDPPAFVAELKARLREVAPDTRVLELPSLRAAHALGGERQVESAGLVAPESD